MKTLNLKIVMITNGRKKKCLNTSHDISIYLIITLHVRNFHYN
jgi:hypothetical protein